MARLRDIKPSNLPGDYRSRDLLALTGWSRKTLFKRCAEGDFPPPYKLAPTDRAYRWDRKLVDNILAERRATAAPPCE